MNHQEGVTHMIPDLARANRLVLEGIRRISAGLIHEANTRQPGRRKLLEADQADTRRRVWSLGS